MDKKGSQTRFIELSDLDGKFPSIFVYGAHRHEGFPPPTTSGKFKITSYTSVIIYKKIITSASFSPKN